MGERVCIVIYEGGCAFVQTLNVTDALWVDGEKVCVCVSVCVTGGGWLPMPAKISLPFHERIAWKEANQINPRKCI